MKYRKRPVVIDAYSEEEFAKMVEKGTKAWEGVPDDWVDNLRVMIWKQN